MKRARLRRAFLALAALMALSPSPAEPEEAGFRPFVPGTWQTIVAAHAGKPFIVHFWGLTCGPCRVEMPRWGEFAQKHRTVPLIMVNADLVPNERGAAFGLMARSGLANAQHWMFDYSVVERLRYEVDRLWQGEIPLTLLIDGSGKVAPIEGTVDFKAIEDWIEAESGGRPR